MLHDKDLALLTVKLQIPLLVRDVLMGKGELPDDVHYGIHEALSDMQPDTALLCMAVTIQQMIKVLPQSIKTDAQVLSLECSRIISEYGAVWMKNMRHENMDNAYILKVLEHIPEDLDVLGDLMEVGLGIHVAENSAAADIINILKIQAGAHAIIAEEFLDVFMAQTLNISSGKSLPQAANGNVVGFPPARVS
jgi:hypothetical protein